VSQLNSGNEAYPGDIESAKSVTHLSQQMISKPRVKSGVITGNSNLQIAARREEEMSLGHQVRGNLSNIKSMRQLGKLAESEYLSHNLTGQHSDGDMDLGVDADGFQLPLSSEHLKSFKTYLKG